MDEIDQPLSNPATPAQDSINETSEQKKLGT
jgi:hypothetical protein